jgi:hypothetical protein
VLLTLVVLRRGLACSCKSSAPLHNFLESFIALEKDLLFCPVKRVSYSEVESGEDRVPESQLTKTSCHRGRSTTTTQFSTNITTRKIVSQTRARKVVASPFQYVTCRLPSSNEYEGFQPISTRAFDMRLTFRISHLVRRQKNRRPKRTAMSACKSSRCSREANRQQKNHRLLEKCYLGRKTTQILGGKSTSAIPPPPSRVRQKHLRNDFTRHQLQLKPSALSSSSLIIYSVL